MTSGRSGAAIAAGIAAVTAWAAWLVYFSVYQVDDAFIVYRYARNLGSGLGLVFNAGERVEGVTCLLWTVLLAPISRWGLPLPVVAPLLTAIAGAATLALLPWTSARVAGRKQPAWSDLLPSLLLAASPSFTFWSVGALETMPFTFLVTLALHAHVRERAERTGVGSAVWLGLAAWVRPETPLLAAAMFARSLGRRVFVLATVFGVLLGALFVFRVAYFGDWLPNTYYAKTGGPLLDRLGAGWNYLIGFAATLAPSFGWDHLVTRIAGLAVAGGLLAWGWCRTELRSVAATASVFVVAAIYEGGDWMVLHRFFVPALPAIALLAGPAIVRLATRSRAAAAVVVTIVLASQVVYGVKTRDGANGLAVNAEGYRHAHLAVARFLADRATPGDTVALMDVGMIGYLTNLPIIDISGLTDREIARSPGRFLDKQFPVERLLDRAPRFFVLVDRFPIDTRIALHPDFLEHYELVFERNHRFNWTPPDSYTLHVFERKGSGTGSRSESEPPANDAESAP